MTAGTRPDALRAGEERFRLLVEAVTDYAVYMLDQDGRVASWNPGAQRFKGYLEAEVLGEHFSRFYTEEDRATGLPARALATALREGRFEQEGWRLRKDGSRFWAHVVIDPIRDATGAHIGFAKITRDITDRREAQLALEASRTALMRSQQLETLGRLIGGIAHDYNNLLAVVVGNLELLGQRLADEPRLRRPVANAMEAAQRGATLTRRMQAFTRRGDLRSEAVDLPSLLAEMDDLLRRTIGTAVRIETRLPPGLPPVLADPSQLELAVLNLLVNARDAMPAGGVVVIAAREDGADPRDPGAAGRSVVLTVTDTGEGMDEATLARAVEPFFSTKGLGKGTGLGLPMVQGFAEASGGRLALHSRPGEGTTAEIRLPVAGAPARERTGEGIAGASHPLTVLAVDDDPPVLANTAAMLDALGHRVIEAPSGEEALRILRREPGIDLLVTDQLMPGMTGAELARAAASERPDLPVVIVTGFAAFGPGETPNLPILGKPFLQGDLARTIQRAIHRAG